mmetsp:Transcript_69034/g.155063  ORF Transcript_69034/g.155063 Transcript_69034/m.155063 type:complete len:589 (-) Transcript_69034:90-1856(-)
MPAKEGQRWEVVGGADKGGILAREGDSIKSKELAPRLPLGTIIEELEMKGERMHYRKLEGDGPPMGWVSLKLKDEILLKQVVASSPSAAPVLKEGQRWEVIGGADKGGILAREGEGLKTKELAPRLPVGTIIEELDIKGDRMHYRKLVGEGPPMGWVSLKIKDEPLIRMCVDELPGWFQVVARDVEVEIKEVDEVPEPEDGPEAEKARLRGEVAGLREQLSLLRARLEGARSTSHCMAPQGAIQDCRFQPGPVKSLWRVYDAEDTGIIGGKTDTLIRLCERNRNEALQLYRHHDGVTAFSPSGHADWLMVMTEVFCQVNQAYQDSWKTKSIDRSYVRVESEYNYENYPFRQETNRLYLCDDESSLSKGGTQIALYRASSCLVEDVGGKFQIIGAPMKDEYNKLHRTMMSKHCPDSMKKEPLGTSTAALFAKINQAFKPTAWWDGCIEMQWTAADAYETVFHPRVADVLAIAHERGPFSALKGKDYASLFLKLGGRVEPGSPLQVMLFVDIEKEIELFIFKKPADNTAAWSGIVKYDFSQCEISQEEISVATRATSCFISFCDGKPRPPPGWAKELLDLSEITAPPPRA